MKVYYNALKRLRDSLEMCGLSNMILSTARGQIANTELFDCDYYDWQDDRQFEAEVVFDGEFLPEYSWGEYILGGMLDRN